MKVLLDGKWKGIGISPDGECLEFQGTVPGCVHTDLLAEGKIHDFYWRDPAKAVQWIEKWNWTYECEFSVSEVYEGTEICFDGLDTYCRIYLNDIEIGYADNMFIPHTFPAKGLRAGKNTLKVAFISPIAMTGSLSKRQAAFTSERLYTRRMQCTYFWDWVERFVTMGIFRSVYLHWSDYCEITDLRCETRAIDDFGALLYTHVDFQNVSGNDFLRLVLKSPDGKIICEKRRRIVEDGITEMIDVINPKLWWPNGYGEHPLYCLCTQIETEEGGLIDTNSLQVGIRTVRILQEPDIPGSDYANKCLKLKKGSHVSGVNQDSDRNAENEFAGFTVIVNGMKVFCKGANWVPCEPFPSAETPEKIRIIFHDSVQKNQLWE